MRQFFLRLINMACFYGGWFVCMHEATGKHPYLGPFLVSILLLYNLLVTRELLVDILLMSSLALFGTVVDSIYIWTGLITFEGGYSHYPSIAPLWITSLWALYASSINHSLEWLKINYWLVAAPLGAAGAISSYLAGVELGAATFHYSVFISYGVIGLVWAIVVPLSLKWSVWLKKITHHS